jgi:hypothetical protein
VDIYCQDLAFPASESENEKHFEDSSSFPVLLIDSVCSLSEADDKTFESAELVKHEVKFRNILCTIKHSKIIVVFRKHLKNNFLLVL